MSDSKKQVCPQCNEPLIKLSSGKLFCRSCGWNRNVSSQKKNTQPINQRPQEVSSQSEVNQPLEKSLTNPISTNIQPETHPENPNNFKKKYRSFLNDNFLYQFGEVIAIVGFLMMTISLVRYDTAVCDRGGIFGDCTHNLGLISNKSSLINTGGFLFVGGSVLMQGYKSKE